MDWNDQTKAEVFDKLLAVIRSLPADSEGFVNCANIGIKLSEAGVDYKQYDFPKLKPFLKEFQDLLEFEDRCPKNGVPPVSFVRPKSESHVFSAKIPAAVSVGKKTPSRDSWLFSWAYIPSAQIKQLSELALEERWYYGETMTTEQENLPILRNYLAYTFKRLCVEEKVLIKTDLECGEEYAAFNTGLVDKKYEYIYALFKKNTKYPSPYWYLLAFVVAGEDIGKTLIKVFNPLPERADYFENKIQNMLYDTSTGALSCDYIHFITERTERLPLEFLKENCSADFLCIDGVDIEDVYHKPTRDTERKNYFISLGNKIKSDSRILNRLKNRIGDAVELALKRVEWNYKTAIPMYFPTKNTGSLLLPLCLVQEDQVDLALVVERQISGAYQGQTILPLHLAYSNSRLVTRPDSDWLRTDMINAADAGDEDE